MRIAGLTFIASMAAATFLTAPVLAKNSDVPKTDDKPTAQSCRAYQQAADGSWTALPCQQTGSNGPTDHKPPQRATDERAR